jgi:hypothetical protein
MADYEVDGVSDQYHASSQHVQGANHSHVDGHRRRAHACARGAGRRRERHDALPVGRGRCEPAQVPLRRPCIALWKPALLAGAALPVVGVDPSIVGTITRADGARQLTIAGWPVHRFAKDKRAGDVAGRCKGGFFAITPDGGRSM